MSKAKSRIDTLQDELFEAQSQERPYPVGLEDFKLLAETLNRLCWIHPQFNSISQADLSGRMFNHATLFWNNVNDSSMRYSRFTNANLYGGTYTNVDFYDANFYKADLESVEFINCNLEDCSFFQADLTRVQGLKTISPVGDHGRLIYAYVYDGEIRIQAGCHNGTVTETKLAVADHYQDDKDGLQDYNDAIHLLEHWGRREIKRLKAAAKNK